MGGLEEVVEVRGFGLTHMPVPRARPTCWTLQCWTVSAVSLATPGSSLRCCSQQSDRSRPGWADMADRKMDWWRAACRLLSAGAERGQRDLDQWHRPPGPAREHHLLYLDQRLSLPAPPLPVSPGGICLAGSTWRERRSGQVNLRPPASGAGGPRGGWGGGVGGSHLSESLLFSTRGWCLLSAFTLQLFQRDARGV